MNKFILLKVPNQDFLYFINMKTISKYWQDDKTNLHKLKWKLSVLNGTGILGHDILKELPLYRVSLISDLTMLF